MQVVETETLEDGSEYERHTNIINPISLTSTSEYYCGVDDTGKGFYYKIPWSFLKEYLEKGKQYIYIVAYDYNGETYENEIYATYGGLTDADIIQNAMDTQTEIIDKHFTEQLEEEKAHHETSKGIWGTLKEVLSYIDPFSENFFVYKLIDLLVNALKSLFIPQDDFFNTYFEELKTWFSDRLGFLSYPLELILDILDRILNINFEEPVINIPDIYEPTTNEKLISARSYNFNSLLENNALKTVHNIYLILVDAVIVFGLVNLLKHKLEEVFTK